MYRLNFAIDLTEHQLGSSNSLSLKIDTSGSSIFYCKINLCYFMGELNTKIVSKTTSFIGFILYSYKKFLFEKIFRLHFPLNFFIRFLFFILTSNIILIIELNKKIRLRRHLVLHFCLWVKVVLMKFEHYNQLQYYLLCKVHKKTHQSIPSWNIY